MKRQQSCPIQVQAFFIPSASMSETLVDGDRVMVNKLAYRFGDPNTGDVIVFDNPGKSDEGESLLGAVIRHVGESLGLSDEEVAARFAGFTGWAPELREVIDAKGGPPGMRARDAADTEGGAA